MTTLTAPETTTTWNIDPVHSVAEFKVKHMMISNVKGHFPKVSGSLTLDESDLAKSHVEASIDASSIETRDPQREAHRRGATSATSRSSLRYPSSQLAFGPLKMAHCLSKAI